MTQGIRLLFAALLVQLFGFGCLSGAGVGPAAREPLPLVDRVDLNRFSGLWYVIESMPTPAEAGAHNATERYAILENGTIDITFRFNRDGFDGSEKILKMTGWPVDESGAEWRVRPVWPVQLDYLILELGDDYDYTVVGHPSKRYVWIMAREPSMSPDRLRGIRDRLARVGYDVGRIQAVPQERSRQSVAD